jgi:hypothetical protein
MRCSLGNQTIIFGVSYKERLIVFREHQHNSTKRDRLASHSRVKSYASELSCQTHFFFTSTTSSYFLDIKARNAIYLPNEVGMLCARLRASFYSEGNVCRPTSSSPSIFPSPVFSL